MAAKRQSNRFIDGARQCSVEQYVAATGDFNADGNADIVWRDNSGNVGIWFMNGSTIASTAVIGNVPTNWVIVGADRKGDIVWRNITTGEVGMWVVVRLPSRTDS